MIKKVVKKLARDSDPKEGLIEAAAERVLEEGLGDMSLRSIAASMGTSHRMLIYHFKSADAFWELVLRHIRHLEQKQRRSFAEESEGMTKYTVKAWERYSSEKYLTLIRLLFELYPKAIREREKYSEFLQDVVSSWLGPLERQFVAELGLDRQEAARRSRLHLATFRGLLLDLLVTEDRKATTDAMEYFAALISSPPIKKSRSSR